MLRFRILTAGLFAVPTAVLWFVYARYFVTDEGFINLSGYFLPEWQVMAPIGVAAVAMWRSPWLLRRMQDTKSSTGAERVWSDAGSGIMLMLMGLLVASLLVTVAVVVQEPSGTFEPDALLITLIAPPLIAVAYVEGWILLVPLLGALSGIAAGRFARDIQL